MKLMEMSGPEDSPEMDTTSFDISAKEARKYKIGDKVEIYISGVVGMLEVPPEDLGDKSGTTDSTIGIRVLDRSISRSGTAKADELAIKKLDDESDDEPDDDEG